MDWTIIDWMYELIQADRRLEAASHPSALNGSETVQDPQNIRVNGIDTTQPTAPDGTPWGKYVG